MSINKDINIKMSYIKPEIMQVMLDNEISLQLQSPPEGPGETFGYQPQTNIDDPFKVLKI